MSAGHDWTDGCLHDLRHALVAGGRSAIATWVIDHVGLDPDRWTDFALALATIAADSMRSAALEAMQEAGVTDPADVVFAPDFGDDPSQLARDVGLLVTMKLNGDEAGMRGVLAAARDRDEVEEVCGGVGLVATHALRAEAVALLDRKGS